MATEPLVSSYQDLVNLLTRQDVKHEAEPSSKSVHIPTVWRNIEGVQVIRWQERDNVIQFIQSTPITVPDDKIPAMESAIAQLNHIMALPGIDLNHKGHIVGYRMALTIMPRGGVLPQEIQSCFRIALQTATGLTPTLHRIVTGEITPEQAVADAQKEFAGQNAPPAPAAPAAPPAPEVHADASSGPFRVD